MSDRVAIAAAAEQFDGLLLVLADDAQEADHLSSTNHQLPSTEKPESNHGFHDNYRQVHPHHGEPMMNAPKSSIIGKYPPYFRTHYFGQ
ncbi:MAG: hypothetical protein ABW185_15885 [Sedimenticola sp.]